MERGLNEVELKTKKIICFDGQIDKLWIENLNIIYNERQLQYMSNGDSIYLEDFKFFFETTNLSHSSPSFVFIHIKTRFQKFR